MELPVYNLEISEFDDTEVDFVALVDKPAIEKNFIAFKDEKKVAFKIEDEDEMIITGALMLADKPIFRSDENGEYYVVFSKKTIKDIAQKFFSKGYQSNVNLMHDNGSKVEGLTMFESWIVDEKRGIKPMQGFEDVPDGSWFGSFKVNNPEVWAMIKSGEVKGFSVEGLFKYKQKPMTEEEALKKIKELLANISI